MTYEFSEEDGILIKKVGNKAIIQSVLLAVGGIIAIIIDFINPDDNKSIVVIWLVVQGLIQVIIGVLFFRPSDNFKRVATTEGKDIHELITGIKELSWGFKMIVYLVVVSIIIDIILIVGYEY
ncbi:MAG: hypothetical protein ACXAD7_15280 [Candidatus Kariarchaeaceae archaeon]|jgi:hypothetical protein